jgi:hypothetical protein
VLMLGQHRSLLPASFAGGLEIFRGLRVGIAAVLSSVSRRSNAALHAMI